MCDYSEKFVKLTVSVQQISALEVYSGKEDKVKLLTSYNMLVGTFIDRPIYSSLQTDVIIYQLLFNRIT